MKRAQKMAKNDYQGARGTHFALFPLPRSPSRHRNGDEHGVGGNEPLVGAIFRPDSILLGLTVGGST